MGKLRSKRKSSAVGDGGPGSKRSKKTPHRAKALSQQPPVELEDHSRFGELLKQSGFILMAGDTPNQLNVDQTMFQMNLTKALKRSSDPEQVIQEFIEGLQNHIEDLVRFRYSLLPTVTKADCESARSGGQEGLMRLLLGIDALQSKLINILLEKLPVLEDEDGDAANLPKLILNQFRWLDRVLNSEEMTSKMMEMVEISSHSMQKEIIACIPEVVADNDSNAIAAKLQDLLLRNSELTIPVLDALSNLNLTPDLMKEVRSKALDILLSASLDDLPVIVNFILQALTSSDAVQVICALRANLDFAAAISESRVHLQQSTSQRGLAKTGGSTRLILDVIKNNMRFHRTVLDGWLKVVGNLKTASQHKVVDIFMLLIAHTVAPNHKKKLETLLRGKVRAGLFREELLRETFSSHTQVLREYFPSILSLAEALLRSPEPTVSLFACCIYREAFQLFDTYCQQEVIGSLVAHIGSGSEGEIEASLDVLLGLVDQHGNRLAQYAIHIKNLLDYLANLSLSQIHKLFAVLAALAFRLNTRVGTIQDELHIVIRKQLSSDSPKYKRIGVIGALMIVRNIAHRQEESGQVQELSPVRRTEVTNLLELVRKNSNKMAEAQGLFFDELANIIEKRQLHSSIEELISENILNDFQNNFVLDIGPENVSGDYGLTPGQEYGLEEEETQDGVAINLLPLVCRVERGRPNQGGLPGANVEMEQSNPVFPSCMASHFRLLRVCEQALNGGELEGIDALLGCPLLTVHREVPSTVASLSLARRQTLCTCLFLTLNWFREVVNAFSGLTDPEMRAKLLGRLKNMTEVQGHLQACLEETPGFSPPIANFDAGRPQESGSKAGGRRGPKPKEKKKSGGKSLDTSALLTDSQDVLPDSGRTPQDVSGCSSATATAAASAAAGTSTAEPSAVDLAQYRPFFRELDMEVFNILGWGPVSPTVQDSEMQSQERAVLRLETPELHFLLEDLCRKLDHALPASSPKRIIFLKTRGDKNVGFSHLHRFSAKEIATQAVKLLPYLCDHLESTSAFFQDVVAQNDGVVDGPGTRTPKYQEMASCLQLLLKALLSITSWSGFLSSENRPLLMDALTVFATRIKSTSRTQPSAEQLFEHSFDYLEKFFDTVPDLPCAISLLRLLVSISDRLETTDKHQNIADMGKKLLCQDWKGKDGQREKGAKHNELLQALLRIYLGHSADVLEAAQKLTTVGIAELQEADSKTKCSSTYPTLNSSSFSCFYRILFEHLVTAVDDPQAGRTPGPSQRPARGQLGRWTTAVKIFHVLVTLIKHFEARNNLNTVLKYGSSFVDKFLKQAMPVLDAKFPTQRKEVLDLLKTLQLSTRSLQHICGHSKVVKDTSVTRHVPALKKGLEQVVYRVEAMLALHGCQDAFWLGNLKNRDLHGNEILSQQSNMTESESGDNDEDSSLPSSSDNDSGSESETTLGSQRTNDSDDDESCSESF